MGTTTSGRVSVEHPFTVPGVLLVLVALVLIAFDLGVLARCGQGEGLCFDVATHGTSDAALVGFFVLFIIGIVLVMYTEASASVTRSGPDPVAAQVTVVSPAPTPPPAQTVVTVTPPR